MRDFKDNAGYVSLPTAMSQANYVFEHKPIDQEESWKFVYLQINKINLEAKDSRFQKFSLIIKQQKEQNKDFDGKYLKILIALLYDIDKEKYESIISQIACFHERNVQADERDMFVSMLLFEIEARKELFLSEFNNVIVKLETPQKVVVNEDKAIELQIENKSDSIIPKQKIIKRKRSSQQHVFILHKKEKEFSLKHRSRKSSLSSRQKIISVLEKHQSFLIYQEAFPLPNGIKRIRIKENFDKILVFIQDYIDQTNLPVNIVIEDDRAKILFKDVKKIQKKERNKVKIRISA